MATIHSRDGIIEMSPALGNRILITGGTGSFGKAFIAEILRCHPDLQRLVVYSRDELKQWELQQQFPEQAYPQLRFFLGDVRTAIACAARLRGSTRWCMPPH